METEMFENDGQEVAASARSLVDHRPPTVSEKLGQEKKELELRLEAVNQLIAQMEANPETRDIIDKLAQLGHRMY
jgi:predicted component of type VI protein secretion system